MSQITVNTNVRRDSEGFEDIDDFWKSAEAVDIPSSQITLKKVVDDDYSTSDEISDDEGDASTRFSYDTNRTIDISLNSTMNTTMNTTPMVGDDGGYDTDENVEGDSLPSTGRKSTSPGRKSTSSRKSGSKSPNSAGMKSTNSSRRVSFGSPIYQDGTQTPFSTISAGEGGLSSGRSSLSSGGRRLSSGSGSDLEASIMSNVTHISTPGSADFPRGQVISDDTFVQEETVMEDESEDEGEHSINESGFTTDDSLVRSAMKRKYRGDSSEDEHSMDSEEEKYGPCRRSRRQTKGQKFQFWKNERAVYDRGAMVGFLQAEPTPRKPKRGTGSRRGGKGPKKQLKFQESENTEPEQPVVLPKGVKFMDRKNIDELEVWDERNDDITSSAVVSLHERSNPMQLPPAENRPSSKKHLVGLAAQSFNVKENSDFMSSWISGYMELPPYCIKDPECVGDCAQVFFVSEGQDNALEFALADPKDEDWNDQLAQRVLLKPRDSFYVPAGNVYRLENHSSTKPCVVYWTIIKALPEYHDKSSTSAGATVSVKA